MSNVQAHFVPYHQYASLLIGDEGARLFARLQAKTRPAPTLEHEHAKSLMRRHFLLAVYGESKTKLAAAAALILPERGLEPFQEQLKDIDIPAGTALLCLTAYSTKLMGTNRTWAEERLLAGAYTLAQESGCTDLLFVGNGRKETVYAPWQILPSPSTTWKYTPRKNGQYPLF